MQTISSQEVNLALWRKRSEYDPSRDFLNWACGFVLREIRSFRKKAARNRLWFSDSGLQALADAWPVSDSNDRDRLDALASCLRKLGLIERQCIAEYYGRQLSGPEIAENSERPVSTIYKILTRARQSLRACVDRTLAQARHDHIMLILIGAFITL